MSGSCKVAWTTLRTALFVWKVQRHTQASAGAKLGLLDSVLVSVENTQHLWHAQHPCCIAYDTAAGA